jgi:hypothetical protein
MSDVNDVKKKKGHINLDMTDVPTKEEVKAAVNKLKPGWNTR